MCKLSRSEEARKAPGFADYQLATGHPGQKTLFIMAIVKITCPAAICNTGEGAPFKTKNVSEATAMALLRKHIASAHPTAVITTSSVTRRAVKAASSRGR